MEWVYLSTSVFYTAYVLALIWSWQRRLQQTSAMDKAAQDGISVIVVIHNEVENIGRLIRVLARQRGIPDGYEIIVVDDRSSDGSSDIVRSLQEEFDCLKLIQTDWSASPCTPKKAGITAALQVASGTLVLVTDGDCIPGMDWVVSMVAPFHDGETKFVSGPVKFHRPRGLWQRWQALEFASLVGAGGAMIGLGYPVMSNGANMAFRRQAFTDVGGYAGSADLASGDDVFLMMKMYGNGGGIRFVKDRNAMVETQPAATWRHFYRQRIRWAGKWRHYPLWYARLLPVFLFTYNLVFIATLALLLAGYVGVVLFAALGVVKIAVEYIFLREIYRFQEEGKRAEAWWFVAASSFVYPFYAVAFGILANISGYEWKGRKYRH